jgi:NAD(P)-dependent dehydrogenase (short-subunit alcohol dehydrogenase family)
VQTTAAGLRVLFTGAAGGIATAAAARLEAEGAHVRGIDVAAAPCVFVADVTSRGEVAEAVSSAVAELGGLDVLVNAAGIGLPQDAGWFPDAEARRVMDVNFFGAWNTTAAALPHLLASRGRVVNVASMLAAVDLPYAAAYCASKRALDAWSNVLRMEYADRLRVVTVYPGYIRTGIHTRSRELGAELEGMARAETLEAAAAGILAACTRNCEVVTFSRRSSVELWLARHTPRIVRAAVMARARRAFAERPRPVFLRPEAGP